MKLTLSTLALALALAVCPGVAASSREMTNATGTATPESAPVQTVAPPPRAIRISGAVAEGNILQKVQPIYPPDAKAQGISGTVVLQAVIGEDGTVHSLTAVSGNDLLKKAALEAVRQWTYRPYLLNGNPVAVDTVININFNLAGTDSTPLTSATPVTQTMANGDTETIKVVKQTAPAPSAVPASVVRVSGGVMAGNLLTKVIPVYPEEAHCKHISSSVVFHVVIGKDGRVVSAEPISGAEVLRKPYADAVKQWTYKPFLLNGQPTEVETTVTLNPQINATGCAPETPQP
jgi:TonB family protein